MLDELEAIDWHGLTHAYGPAGDVPETLQALASGASSAADAANIFWGNIYHQGTVYEATAHVVPFLIELLENERIADREWLLLLLHSLAEGSSYRAIHGNGLLREDTEGFEDAKEREMDWVRLAYEAVGKGIPSYLNLLQDTSPSVRTAAALVLSCFPEDADMTLPKLRRSLPSELRRDVQASLLLCLGTLRDPDAATGKALGAALRHRRDDPRRLAAALGILRRDRETAEPAAARIVQDVLADPETFPDAYVFSAWDIEADPGSALYEALLLLGREKAVTTLLDVLDRSEEPSDILIDTLIEVGFPDSGEVVLAPDALTASQHRILTALLQTEVAWKDSGEWMAGPPPERYGLPESREGVEQLLKVKGA